MNFEPSSLFFGFLIGSVFTVLLMKIESLSNLFKDSEEEISNTDLESSKLKNQPPLPPPLVSPEDLDPKDKMMMLKEKLDLSKNLIAEILSLGTPQLMTKSGSDIELRVSHGSLIYLLKCLPIAHGFIVEISASSKAGQNLRYLEDLATFHQEALFTHFRAELTNEEFDKFRPEIKSLFKSVKHF